MDAVLLSVLGIAVLDSINPSALVATIALLLRGGGYTPKVLTYVTGIFATYFGIGAALMLGLDAAGSVLRDGAVGTVAYGAQGVLGAAMLGYALIAPSKPKPRPAGGGGCCRGRSARGDSSCSAPRSRRSSSRPRCPTWGRSGS